MQYFLRCHYNSKYFLFPFAFSGILDRLKHMPSNSLFPRTLFWFYSNLFPKLQLRTPNKLKKKKFAALWVFLVDTDDTEILVMSPFIQIIYTTLQSLSPLISISTIMSVYYPISATQFHGSVFNQILSITAPLKMFDFKISNSVHNHLYFHSLISNLAII